MSALLASAPPANNSTSDTLSILCTRVCIMILLLVTICCLVVYFLFLTQKKGPTVQTPDTPVVHKGAHRGYGGKIFMAVATAALGVCTWRTVVHSSQNREKSIDQPEVAAAPVKESTISRRYPSGERIFDSVKNISDIFAEGLVIAQNFNNALDVVGKIMNRGKHQ